MRKILLNKNFYHKEVVYTLLSHDRKGVEIEATMETGKFQFYHPASWKNFKRWIVK